MRTEIIKIIEALKEKDLSKLETYISKLEESYHKMEVQAEGLPGDIAKEDRLFTKRVLNIFHPDDSFKSYEAVLDDVENLLTPKDHGLMTLQESSEIMKTGDTFKIENDGARLELYEMADEQKKYFKSWATSKDIILSPSHFKMRGTIIPADPKTPPKKTAQITKKEYYHIKIGGEDFGDFMVESEWEGMKKLINEDKGLTVIIAIDPVDRIGEILGFSENGIKIVMAHPDIAVALKNRDSEEQIGKCHKLADMVLWDCLEFSESKYMGLPLFDKISKIYDWLKSNNK